MIVPLMILEIRVNFTGPCPARFCLRHRTQDSFAGEPQFAGNVECRSSTSSLETGCFLSHRGQTCTSLNWPKAASEPDDHFRDDELSDLSHSKGICSMLESQKSQ